MPGVGTTSPDTPSHAAEALAGWARTCLNGVLRAFRIVRTGLCFVLVGFLALLVGVVVIPLLQLAPPGDRERRERRAQAAIQQFLRVYMLAIRVLRVMRVECVHPERLQAPGQLVVANHPSMMDALAVMSFMPQADCVVKPRFYTHRFLGAAARGAGYISSDGGAHLVDECVARLRRGRSVLIFPEGTRSPVHGLGPFARGAAHMALRAGIDPLPVTIRCEPPSLYHGQPWWKVPDRIITLTLNVGEPIPIKDAITDTMSRPRAARAVTDALRDHFER